VYPNYYPYYSPYYNRYYDPWGYGAFGLGYFYYSPWGWSPGYSGYYGYGAPRYSAYGYDDELGRVKLKVKPRDAEVYVDGYFAGHVDDFDGTFQSLKLDSGGYRIEISSQAPDSAVHRAMAHEVAEIREVLARYQPGALQAAGDPHPYLLTRGGELPAGARPSPGPRCRDRRVLDR
jgi:hypothetical protein